jgi:hypothetical protein
MRYIEFMFLLLCEQRKGPGRGSGGGCSQEAISFSSLCHMEEKALLKREKATAKR